MIMILNRKASDSHVRETSFMNREGTTKMGTLVLLLKRAEV